MHVCDLTNWQSRAYVQKVSLVVIDEIHLLGADRGPILEVIVSRMRYISARTKQPVRIVGLSTALANARDLGDWLGIEDEGLFNFRPSVRPVPLECHIQGFPGKFYCPRMMTMNKPTYAAIRTHSPEKPTLVFVSSRRQTRLTAMDLIAYAAADERPEGFVHMSANELAGVVRRARDPALKHCLQFGIGIHHAGLSPEDRAICEELFAECKIQVLVCTSTLAWGVNLPAHLCIIKGTEFYDGKSRRYVDFPITDVLQMMGRAGRPQFDKSGCCVIMVHEPKKAFYKKFLYEPFPVESSLADNLPDHFNAEVVAGTIRSKQDAVDYLTWTYFFRRLVQNPSYYDCEGVEHAELNAFLSRLVENALVMLEDARCVEIGEDDSVAPLLLGRIASYYYLQHPSVALFASSLSHANTVEQLLKTLCGVAEYDELPVRHNEDKVNAELAIRVKEAGGFAVDARLADDPHTKANLLFQAHFLRVPLPMSDYVTDTKSVLDQAIRIIQAIIDVASDAGWLHTALNAMRLMQMVMQGRFLTDSPLTTLPHVDAEVAGKLRRGGVKSLPQFVTRAIKDRAGAKKALCAAGLSGRTAEETTNVAARYPSVMMRASSVKTSRASAGGGKADEGVVEVHLKRLHARGGKDGGNGGGGRSSAPRAVCPLFPKLKEEGWWLVLGDRISGELLALRRVGFGGAASAKLTYAAPDAPIGGGRGPELDLVVHLVSDCYVGMDQDLGVSEGLPASIDAEEDGDSSDDDGFWLPAAAVAERMKAASETARRLASESESESESEDDEAFWEDETPTEEVAAAAVDQDAFFWEGEGAYLAARGDGEKKT